MAVASEAVQLMGGYGYMKEYDVERFYRDAKTLELIGGNAVDGWLPGFEKGDDLISAFLGGILLQPTRKFTELQAIIR